MIAVDTSALVAIALKEPERAAFSTTILNSDRALVSAVSVVEAQMVTYGRRGDPALPALEEMLALPVFEIVSPGLEEIDIAHDAFRRFGKGSGHPAKLNFGDLFSYALARSRGIPLLYKGDDFAHTDLVSAAAA